VDAVLTRAGVAFAYLFGSRATGRHCAGSDADVGIRVPPPLRLLEEVALAQALASALDVPAVDLVDLDRAPLRLKGRIVQEGRLLFSADEPARWPSRSGPAASTSTSVPPWTPIDAVSCNGSPREASMVDLDRLHERLETPHHRLGGMARAAGLR